MGTGEPTRDSTVASQVQSALLSGEPAALQAALALVTSAPHLPDGDYLRGRLLAALGRTDEAAGAFERALAADPSSARAHYSLGVLLAGKGREDDAVAHWEQAVAADPRHVDALYNLGQTHYNRGQFERALERWEAARSTVPTDFELLKKVVQVQNALGREEDAAETLRWLADVWQSSPDPRVRNLDEVVVDQYRVRNHAVLVYRMLRPRSDDLYYVYTFRVLSPGNRVVATVQLESSAYGREQGMPYVLGATTAAGHQTTGPGYATMPPYPAVKSAAARVIERIVPAAS